MKSTTQAQISLKNLGHNFALLQGAAGADRVLIPVVKADAYGHGAVRVSQYLISEFKINYLAVAFLGEAVALRAAGINAQILLFTTTFKEDLAEAILAGLDLTISSAAQLHEVVEICRNKQLGARVQIKINTGMNRLGCAPESFEELYALAQQSESILLTGIYTHLACSEHPGNQSTQSQTELFKKTLEPFDLSPELLVHSGNSGSLIYHQQSGTNAARAGLSLYGIPPGTQSAPVSEQLKPVMQIVSRVSYLQNVNAGSPVGYNGTWNAENDTILAIIPLGYADGYPWQLGNQAQVIINQQSYPVVGRVCMDQVLVEIGTESDILVGDIVSVMSEDMVNSAQTLARQAGTIPYDILCGFSARVQRTYPDPS